MASYPSRYQPPMFRKFDGTGSAKEHIMSFLDDLRIYRSNKNLRLREFSKSLLGRAFTWYAKLRPYSIETWEDLVMEFCGKFLEEEEARHIMDLGRNIKDGSQIFLSLSGITTFAELMRKAVDVTDAMKRQGKRTKGPEDMFDVCVAEERERKKTFKSSRSPGKATTYNTNEVSPIPLNRLQICQLVEEWLKDGTLRRAFHKQVNLGKVLLLEEEREEELQKRPLPNHSVNTVVPSTYEIRIKEVEEETYDEEKPLAVGLVKTRGFRVLFAQLAAIIFREPTNLNSKFCHNRPLYVEATIKGIKVRRALVDNGLGVNIIPSYLFRKLRMPKSRIRMSDVTLSTFHGEAVESLGCVHAVLEDALGYTWTSAYLLHSTNGVKAPFEASESHLIDTSLFDKMAPQEAFKRPRAKNPTGIEKEYLPNGKVRWRVL
ncbi:Aspartic peptidase domain superfamily [Sesbania bispinosa]|nr:Aspartic peptidase domain superfamily [Sesbania bispinosa]